MDGKTNHRRSFDGCWGNSDVEFNSEPLVLGQSLSSDGAFLGDASFTGNITSVNMWDYAMNEEQVLSVVTNCSHATGNVLRWPLFRNELEQGSVIKTEQSHCIGAGMLDSTLPHSPRSPPPPPPPPNNDEQHPCFGFDFIKLTIIINSDRDSGSDSDSDSGSDCDSDSASNHQTHYEFIYGEVIVTILKNYHRPQLS